MMEDYCSSDSEESINKYSINFQPSPPNMHHQNAAEQAIRNCKNHFISGLTTTDPDFPISKRDRLLYQYLITLNLICNTRANPALSAYAYIYGPYDFNKSPMETPGTRMVLHNKTVN